MFLKHISVLGRANIPSLTAGRITSLGNRCCGCASCQMRRLQQQRHHFINTLSSLTSCRLHTSVLQRNTSLNLLFPCYDINIWDSRSRTTCPHLFQTIAGSWISRRWKHQRRSSDRTKDSDDSDSDTEELDDNESDNFHFEEDAEFPVTYKDIKSHVKSLRLDGIVSAGLNISRNKVDEYFLSSKLKHNGDRVLKKSKQVQPGDYVDLVTEVIQDKIKVKRVRVLKVSAKKTRSDRKTVHLRVWRGNVTVDNPDKQKYTSKT